MAPESQENQPTRAAAPVAGAAALLRGATLPRVLRRSLIALLLVGCACLLLVYRLRPRHTEISVHSPAALPEDAHQAARGFTHTQSEGRHPVFTIRAQRSVEFEGKQGTTLEGVEVEIFGRNGDRHDLVSTDSCRYESSSGDFSCAGPVEIELNAPRTPQPAEAGSEHAAPTVHDRQPIYLETAGLAYDQQRSLATTEAPVKWRYGPASGSATGLTYATRDGWIELQRDVAVNWPVRGVKGATAPSVLKLSAAHLRYGKTEQQIEMAGPVRVDEGDRHLEAQHALVSLDAKNRLTEAVLDGGVIASDPSGASSLSAQAASLQAEFDPPTGQVRHLDAGGNVHVESRQGPTSGATWLTADHVRVGFVGAHLHPDQGFAAGNVQLTAQPARRAHSVVTASAPSQGSLRSEELDAGQLQFSFHPADGTLDHANTVGAGKLILIPTSVKEGKRVVTAGQFLMAFDRQGRLTTLRGLAPTHIIFEPAQNAPAGSVAADSRADNLQAQLNPISQALESLQQSERYQFVDGDRQASADQADYSADASVVTLTGKPALRDPETQMSSDRFVCHLATNSAEGYGHVTSTHLGPLEASASDHKAQPKAAASLTPGLPSVDPGWKAAEGNARPRLPSGGSNGKPDSPGNATNVLADRVTTDRTKQWVHYEGHVRAWRGTDVVEAPSLDIYRTDRRIVADHGVLTSNLVPVPLTSEGNQNSGSVKSDSVAAVHGARGDKETPGAAQPVTIRADRLEYLDLGNTAAYQGHVRMDHAGAALEANRLDAYFSKALSGQASELERAVASGSVTIVQTGRRAAGDHAEYFAADGRIELSGGPPTLYDTEKGLTTGRVLTFFTGSDTLQVDGGQGSRALSKHRLSQ
jgi:lipopolysaccharide export system protein LptA